MLSLLLLAACPPVPQTLADPARVLRTRFAVTASVPESPKGVPLDLWIPIPSTNELQTISGLAVSGAKRYRVAKEPVYGNRMVHVQTDGGALRIDVSYVVARRTAGLAAVRKERGSLAARSLLADRLVPLDGSMQEIASDVVGDETTAPGTMKKVFDHVVATMQYDYKKESPHLGEGDVAFVCDYKKGNCSDLHSYVIALARIRGIPAYLEYGFPITGIPLADPIPKTGKVGGYHCWTWFFDSKRGWLPLDASDARRWLDSGKKDVSDAMLGSLVLERSAVAVSRGRDVVLSPKQNGPALNYFVYPYAESGGKPVDATWEIVYTQLGG